VLRGGEPLQRDPLGGQLVSRANHPAALLHEVVHAALHRERPRGRHHRPARSHQDRIIADAPQLGQRATHRGAEV
jgi:hypothetical protein